MQLRSVEITELPDREVLYLKKWQGNNFYPLYKATKVGFDEWHVHPLKNSGWSQSFCTYTNSSFLYLIRNNGYLVTDFPMHNDDKFNFE